MTTHQPQAPGSDSHGTRWAIHPSRVLGGGIRVAGESVSHGGSVEVDVCRMSNYHDPGVGRRRGVAVRIRTVYEALASVSLLFLAEIKKAVARMPVLVKTTVSKSVATALEWAAARQSRDNDRKRTANPNPTIQVESLCRCSGLPDSITASRRR